MNKSFDVISHHASRLIRSEGASVRREAAAEIRHPVRPESRFAQSANRAMTPLVRANPLVRTGMPTRVGLVSNPLGLLNLGRLGGVRAYSDDLPPTSLITRYKPVLEDAIAHREEMVELVEYGNYSIASFVEISLDIIPGISSVQLDNGYSILGIKETAHVKDSAARMYDLQVMPPDRPGQLRKPFVLPITVYKADAVKEASPQNLKMLLGLCSAAVDIHRGKLPRKLYSSIQVFSPTFQELGKLYTCADKVQELISYGAASTPEELFKAIGNQLKARAIDPKSQFVPPLKSMLIETFKNKYPGFDQEIERLLDMEKTPQPALFRHAIDHKGGAYRAAMKMNALVKGNPDSGFSAICVRQSAESGEQTFAISFHPAGVWVEQKTNPQTGQLEAIVFATPQQLSEVLKQRGVQSIISQSLGML